MKLLKKVLKSLKNNRPFVVYNKPNEVCVSAIFQKDDVLHTVDENFNIKGFIFAPFSNDKPTVLIPLSNSEFIQENFEKENIVFSKVLGVNDKEKDNHISLVRNGVEAIKNNEFKKVVLSRKVEVSIRDFDIISVYKKLLHTYPNAFVYVWFHPKIGLWCGATPETLVELKNNKFSTMSLAGTQPYSENPNWTQKEIEEQQFVTEYIVSKLSKFSTGLQLSKTQTVKAGSLAHLRTEIKGNLNIEIKGSLYSLVDLLHPTPAVCGLPKEIAKEFILKNENYNRTYYTGYLGEINMSTSNKDDSHLFVNLRCMEIKNEVANIYVGGGITKESIPEREWEETIAKSNIMLSVL